MGTFCISESGEIITCNCFFEFWIYHVNHQKRTTFTTFNDILQKVSSDDIEEYLDNHQTSMFLKKISIFYDGDSPCAVITICKSCHENSLMRIADIKVSDFGVIWRPFCEYLQVNNFFQIFGSVTFLPL